MTYQCEHCGETVNNLADYEHNDDGWWCECNDYGDLGYFNFFDQRNKPQLKIFLEDADHGIPIATLPKNQKIKTRLSPFRYPGGKSKLAKFIATLIRQDYNQVLISPFCGGASVELGLLDAGIVKKLILNDLDPFVYNVFDCILNHTDELLSALKPLKIDHDLFTQAKQTVLNQRTEPDNIKRALLTLINNRCSYSGIYYAGALGGKHGTLTQLTSRFNVDNLVKRIQQIAAMRNDITLLNCDVHDVLQEYSGSHGTFYLDPPYVKNGPKLYAKNYAELSEHYALLFDVQENFEELPSDDILLFYDNDPFIAQHCCVEPTILKRRFTVNKTTA